jgi:hypothetical protein
MPDAPPLTEGLVVYWFPSSVQEFQKSSLRTSRILSLYASECVAMEVADAATPLGQKLATGAKLPIVVLATPDGVVVGKAENKDGFLRVDQVEKLVDAEYKRRETQVDSLLKDAKEHAKSGDNVGAIPIYKSVLEQKCLFPKKAKDAAKALKKLGVEDTAALADAPDFPTPIFDPTVGARVPKTQRTIVRPKDCIRWPATWIPLTPLLCVTWGNSIVITLAIGRKRTQHLMQFFPCLLIRSLEPLPCTEMAK